MTIARQLVRVAVVVALTGFLSGCVQSLPIDRFEGPIAIRNDSGTLTFVVCRDITVVSIYAEERNVGQGLDWTPFIDVTGDSDIVSGSVMSVATLPSKLQQGTMHQPAVNEGSEYSFLVGTRDGSMLAAFKPVGKLSESDWLHSDGSVTAEPCE